MPYDLQTASVLKRIAAYMFDVMMLMIAFSLFATLLSWATGYNKCSREYDAIRLSYEEEYGITMDISAEEYEALSEERRAQYEAADAAIKKDESAIRAYNMMFNLSILISVLGLLFSFLLLEFMLPALFENGQTLGKKMFGIGVMQYNGVKLSGMVLFVRAILVKYTVETMIPVLLGIMVYFAVIDALGVVLIAGLLLLQVLLLAFTRARTPIHDKLASTVTVDLASQMIFESREALLAYQKRIHAEQAEKAEYGRL